jgi:RNA polymerase sigma-70 factor (ECF subfamily)
MTDTELVQQILDGNANAFRFLVSNNQRIVLHIAGRVVGRQEDVEDICQEVFTKVFRQIRKFRGEAKLSTWIATIAYNTSISHLRKQKQRQEISIDESPGIVANKEEVIFPANLLEKEEAKACLLKLVEQLPVHYRTVLTLFHLEEFSYREIEQITGMPEGTVKSYLSRARSLLKDKIEEVFKSEKTNIFADYVEKR